MVFGDVYSGKTVLVTGHTGFKGSWLSEWLSMLGANVVGYSLKPDPDTDPCTTRPSHFGELGLGSQISAHIENDVRSLDGMVAAVSEYEPDFIFHLAAQPLVLRSYDEPVLTIETNVLGSVNVLEAVRLHGKPCVVIMVTTDKVYDNLGWVHSYREPDALGGHDPYSASKACAELVISSYRDSFFSMSADAPDPLPVAIASVRGGNVIGGGDWAENRIVPDSMRALSRDEPVVIRNRCATRPWQHVLELLSGYLHLGSRIYQRRDSLSATARGERKETLGELEELCSAFNFGPFVTSNRSVGALVEEIFRYWPGSSQDQTSADARVEAGKLNLTIDKAYHFLGWQPRWSFEETIQRTVEWYRQYYETAQGDSGRVRDLTQSQIEEYSAGLKYPVS